MKTYTITLTKIEDLKNFVKGISKFDFPINVSSINRSAVYDAKSIIALLSLDLSLPICITPYTTDIDKLTEFTALIKDYLVKDNG